MQTFGTPSILYEDNHILLAIKPPGLPSQSGRSGRPDMLGLLERDLAQRAGKPGRAFLGLVHRLDQPTSGLMVFAKTSKAASRLSRAFRDRQVKKTYLAICRGLTQASEGHMQDRLSRQEVEGRVQVLEGQEGYEALLDWQLLRVDKEKEESLLLLDLITGRRHQIRVQLASRDLPLLGDRRYGLMDARDQGVPTLALHACGLSFPHPTLKKPLTFWLGPEINPSFSKEDQAAFDHFLKTLEKET